MYLVQLITMDSRQSQIVTIPDGTSVAFELYFSAGSNCWFFTSITYSPTSFSLTGIRATNNPNLIHQWRHQVPFGIGIFSVGNREPQLLQDFNSGNSKMYILTADEVTAYQSYLQGIGTLS